MKQPRCDQCRFYVDSGHQTQQGERFESMGDCHRYPPKYNPGSEGFDFTPMDGNEWCGEFIPVFLAQSVPAMCSQWPENYGTRLASFLSGNHLVNHNPNIK